MDRHLTDLRIRCPGTMKCLPDSLCLNRVLPRDFTRAGAGERLNYNKVIVSPTRSRPVFKLAKYWPNIMPLSWRR